MKDKFLNDARKNSKDKNFSEKAYNSIAENIIHKNIKGKEKAKGLDEYDTELLSNTTLLPGNIYTFIYKADKPTTYSDSTTTFEYYDSLPLLLVTHYSKNLVRGINLNLCSKPLRAHILNVFYNIDTDFFDRDALHEANKKLVPFSKKIGKMLLDENTEKKIITYIQLLFKLKNIGLIYRNYSASKIKNPRLIEIWLWKYIPSLTYKQTIKQDILNKIYAVTGTSNIRL